jgi:hypothetical protein
MSTRKKSTRSTDPHVAALSTRQLAGISGGIRISPPAPARPARPSIPDNPNYNPANQQGGRMPTNISPAQYAAGLAAGRNFLRHETFGQVMGAVGKAFLQGLPVVGSIATPLMSGERGKKAAGDIFKGLAADVVGALPGPGKAAGMAMKAVGVGMKADSLATKAAGVAVKQVDSAVKNNAKQQIRGR